MREKREKSVTEKYIEMRKRMRREGMTEEDIQKSFQILMRERGMTEEEIKEEISVSIENLDEHVLELQKYKEGNYKFGNYRSDEEISKEILKGKIFVLKGGMKVGDWILTIIFFTIIVVSLFCLLASNIGVFILPLIFTIPFSPLLLLKARDFVVIGPLGVYYQKMLKKGSFSWDNVYKVDWINCMYIYPPVSTQSWVTVYFLNQKKEKFNSQWYLNKEFPRKTRRRMFVNLFYFYFKLGKDKK